MKNHIVSSRIKEKQIIRHLTREKFPLSIWRYILSDFFFSFLIVLVFFVVIFIVNQILLLTKNILQIDIPIFEVIKLLFFALPNIFSLSIPFSTLVACLMSVGHFSTYNEFVAMKANGISFISIFIPYFFLAIVIMLFSLLVNEVFLPLGTIQFSKQYRFILGLNPQLSLEQNSIKRYQDDIIITKRVNNQSIEGIIIIDQDSSGDKRVILADTAYLINNANENGIISVELNNVNSLSTGDTQKEYNYFLGKKMIYNILLKDLTLDVQRITPDQKSITDLIETVQIEYNTNMRPYNMRRAHSMSTALSNINTEYQRLSSHSLPSDLTAPINKSMVAFQETRTELYNDRTLRITEVVLYRKLAFPFAAMLFVLIAFPMGLFYKRSGRTVGFGIGLIVSFAYWFITVLNQSIGINSSYIPSFIIIWYPNFLLLITGFILLILKKY